jgi:hypothetical protein
MAINPLQDNSDSDSHGDVYDNCITTANDDQHDIDTNTEGDTCDVDYGYLDLLVRIAGRVKWQDETVYETFNAYRGDMANLRSGGPYTQDPVAVPMAGSNCDMAVTNWQDSVTLSVGEIVYYLATGESGGVESGLDADSSGTPRPNANPCP